MSKKGSPNSQERLPSLAAETERALKNALDVKRPAFG